MATSQSRRLKLANRRFRAQDPVGYWIATKSLTELAEIRRKGLDIDQKALKA